MNASNKKLKKKEKNLQLLLLLNQSPLILFFVNKLLKVEQRELWMLIKMKTDLSTRFNLTNNYNLLTLQITRLLYPNIQIQTIAELYNLKFQAKAQYSTFDLENINFIQKYSLQQIKIEGFQESYSQTRQISSKNQVIFS